MIEEREQVLMELMIEKTYDVLDQAKLAGIKGAELRLFADGVIAMGTSMLDEKFHKQFIDIVLEKESLSEIYK